MSTDLFTNTDRPLRLSRRVDFSAAFMLFQISVSRLVRGRRLLILILLFSLPLLVAGLAQAYSPKYEAERTELLLVFGLIPQTLVPLTALMFASGMIQDEIEEQTITYLFIRPIPRWVIYTVKLLATVLVTSALTTVFTFLTYTVVYWSEPTLAAKLIPMVPIKVSGAMLLALAAYASLFSLVSVFTKRSLVVGIIYILTCEGMIANNEFMIRKWTILYQFRVILLRGLGVNGKEWSINLEYAPTLEWAAIHLGIATLVFLIAGCIKFSRSEFRVKSPEGN
jgi:ABC-2 type transport system permease protein